MVCASAPASLPPPAAPDRLRLRPLLSRGNEEGYARPMALRRIPRPALLIAAAVALSAQDAPGAASWYRLVDDDGAVVGHGSQTVTRTPDGRETVDTQELLLAEPGDPATRTTRRTVTREDESGRPVLITDMNQSGRTWTRIEARIDADRAEIARATPTGRQVTSVALPKGVRFDMGSGLLRSWDIAATPRLEFDNFSLAAMGIEHVVIEPVPGGAATGPLAVLRKRYEGGELRSIARLTLGPDRRILTTAQPMFGTSIVTQPIDQATALAPQPPYRVLASVMVKSLFRIEDSVTHGHIRYRFAFRDGIAFTIPETGEQRVSATPEGATVDICADCGPGAPSDAATLSAALRPTAWMQSDAVAIRKIASTVMHRGLSPAEKMKLLVDQARGYIGKADFVGHYSALETLRRQAGDCTEASVLLGALGRAAGIPTRVVNGMVYSRTRYHGVSNVFLPHSWVIAWVGDRWQSYDSALESFDSTHIALTIGDGDARSIQAASQLAGLLRWDAMGEVRTRPGT